VFAQQIVGARVVAGGEVDLGKPESVVIVFYGVWTWFSGGFRGIEDREGSVLLVIANSLSPMKMADSYCALLRASWRQSRRNLSMLGCGETMVVSHRRDGGETELSGFY
jgi:hypothetical protein